jgi:hypothetical protein
MLLNSGKLKDTMSSTVLDLPRSQAPSSIERWYVLILTCLIYAINIADRYVVSTVLEPIRLELKLNDAGVAVLTGAPLAAFQSPQYPRGLSHHLVGIHRPVRAVAKLSGVFAGTHRRRRR